MTKLTTRIREWLPAAFSVTSILLTAVYATTNQGRAAEQIRRLAGLGTNLTQASKLAQAGVLSPQAAQQLGNRLNDLEKRMAESQKPGLVQAELMAAAREAGLEVREVQPVAGSNRLPGKDSTKMLPAYRVLVEGSYGQIAEYLEASKRQRLPARACSFRLAIVTNEQGIQQERLRAEITMESFVPPASSAEEANRP